MSRQARMKLLLKDQNSIIIFKKARLKFQELTSLVEECPLVR